MDDLDDLQQKLAIAEAELALARSSIVRDCTKLASVTAFSLEETMSAALQITALGGIARRLLERVRELETGASPTAEPDTTREPKEPTDGGDAGDGSEG